MELVESIGQTTFIYIHVGGGTLLLEKIEQQAFSHARCFRDLKAGFRKKALVKWQSHSEGIRAIGIR